MRSEAREFPLGIQGMPKTLRSNLLLNQLLKNIRQTRLDVVRRKQHATTESDHGSVITLVITLKLL